MLVHHVHHEDFPVFLIERFRAHCEETGGHDVFLFLFGVSRRHQVARHLFLDELVVRLVLVEGFYDVIAVTPGLGIGEIALHPGGFGVTGDIHPVPAPTLAELAGGKQFVDHLLEGFG